MIHLLKFILRALRSINKRVHKLRIHISKRSFAGYLVITIDEWLINRCSRIGYSIVELQGKRNKARTDSITPIWNIKKWG